MPPELLLAVSAVGGGRIAFVVGAGCSVENPTGIPISSKWSEDVFRRLVADGVLDSSDCSNPADLSSVADAVFAKTGSQRAMVDRLCAECNLKLATPNEGYLITAAMICEGAVSSVVTLNFDLALSNALSQLGAGNNVGVIECPNDLPRQKAINVYYLHRNANAPDPESWVLRTVTLLHEWRTHWEPLIATKVLTAPVVVFAGLGTPVAVLLESVKLLREALPGTPSLLQVDPAERTDSRFFSELRIDASSYIRCGWSQFMSILSRRMVGEQIVQLGRAVEEKVRDDRLPSEDVAVLLNDLKTLGLVELGTLRGHWLLHDKPYCPSESSTLGLIADLLLALALVARISGTLAVIVPDGPVEFRRDDRVVAVCLVVSGRGHRGKMALEAEVQRRDMRHRNRPTPLRAVVVAGTSDSWSSTVTPPSDIVWGDESEDIVGGQSICPMFHVSELRADDNVVRRLIP